MWRVWTVGEPYRRVDGFEPLLAQWEKSTHPAQIRLHEYLDWVTEELGPLPAKTGDLYLRLRVAVNHPDHLLHHHDLENYLTPLFGARWLDPHKFVMVSACKRVGGTSSIEIGLARGRSQTTLDADWVRFSCSAGSGPSTKAWKERIRCSLEAAVPEPLPAGPVETHLAWRCSPRRNWVNLWKPTGDTMGPVLGYASASNPFHPNDDRIVELTLHKQLDPEIGHDVDVDMWWRVA